jgi:transcriptional antiterminator NusG
MDNAQQQNESLEENAADNASDVTNDTAAEAGPADDATDAAKPAAKKPGGKRARWYIVHAYSGFEKKIEQAIHERAVQNDIADHFEEVVVPTQDVLEVRRGKKVTTEKKFFPGYLLVKMVLTDESWHMVKSIDKVTGFLGQGGKPQSVPQREVDAIFQQIEEGVSAAQSGVIFEVGENVKITDGPFESFTGMVEEVDEEREKVKVSVAIFGRTTPVELGYTQVEKIA